MKLFLFLAYWLFNGKPDVIEVEPQPMPLPARVIPLDE